MSTWSALAELTPLEFEKVRRRTKGRGANPTPCQSRSARMGGWHTVTTPYGGPQNSTK